MRSLEFGATSGPVAVTRQQQQLTDASQIFSPQPPQVKQQHFKLPAVGPMMAPQTQTAAALVPSASIASAHQVLQSQLQSTGLASAASRTSSAGGATGAVPSEESRHLGLGDVMLGAPSSQAASQVPLMGSTVGKTAVSEHAKPATSFAQQQQRQQHTTKQQPLPQMTAAPQAPTNMGVNAAAALAMFSSRTTGMLLFSP